MRPGLAYELYDLLVQRLPAQAVDLVRAKLLRQQIDPRTSCVRRYQKGRQYCDTLAPFTSNEWHLSDSNVYALYRKLGPADQQVFHFDVGALNWQDYLRNYILAARVYTMHDGPESVSRALESVKK